MSILVIKCQCGAISVESDDFSNSMTPEAFAQEFPELTVPEGDPGYYQCNHCVNKWGLDLCGCGSGEPVGECQGEYEDCLAGRASQDKGRTRERGMWAGTGGKVLSCD